MISGVTLGGTSGGTLCETSDIISGETSDIILAIITAAFPVLGSLL